MKYPSQYEAQLVIDTYLALQSIHTGYAADSITAEYVCQWKESLASQVNALFLSPETSPWEIKWKRTKTSLKPVLQWREGWGKD